MCAAEWMCVCVCVRVYVDVILPVNSGSIKNKIADAVIVALAGLCSVLDYCKRLISFSIGPVKEKYKGWQEKTQFYSATRIIDTLKTYLKEKYQRKWAKEMNEMKAS